MYTCLLFTLLDDILSNADAVGLEPHQSLPDQQQEHQQPHQSLPDQQQGQQPALDPQRPALEIKHGNQVNCIIHYSAICNSMTPVYGDVTVGRTCYLNALEQFSHEQFWSLTTCPPAAM
jgi:hypothetical protein